MLRPISEDELDSELPREVARGTIARRRRVARRAIAWGRVARRTVTWRPIAGRRITRAVTPATTVSGRRRSKQTAERQSRDGDEIKQELIHGTNPLQ